MERGGMGLAAETIINETTMEQGIVNNKVLLEQLQQLQQTGGAAALFVEDSGLGNENGKVTAITGEGDNSIVELDGERSFPISSIMAVNGVFRTGFSTC
jgi:hypothetical protein